MLCGLLSTELGRDKYGVVHDEKSNRFLAAIQSRGISQFPESGMCFPEERSEARAKATPRMTEQQGFPPLRVRSETQDVSCSSRAGVFGNNTRREKACYTECAILCVSILIGN